ncbi:MAG TPA: hypothetical protein VM370_00380 [Candidatus Thermoplasmatota archaeon]|nr:hypothetical protein [Candidatus Thermoplasmatota archaeon]
MLRTILIAACLLTVVVPMSSFAAEEETPALPAWLQAILDERGIEADPADIVVTRTVTHGADVHIFQVPLSAIAQADPFAGTNVAAPAVPDVLVGELTLHFMLQLGNCDGYGAQAVADGVSLIQDASWDLGIHLALGPLGGGVAASTGGDPVTNTLLIAGEDSGATLAAGDLSITEDRITIFGICLLTIGTMSGTGAWDWA